MYASTTGGMVYEDIPTATIIEIRKLLCREAAHENETKTRVPSCHGMA